MKTVNFIKIRDVKTPNRANDTDAGVDFFVPNDSKPILLNHGESVNIPSGIQVEVPKNYALVFFNKSGLGKKGLVVGAQVVDCGYTGEVHLNVWNVSNNQITIHPGTKLVQAIIMPIGIFQFTEKPKQYNMNTYGSSRGSKGFGSSGSK